MEYLAREREREESHQETSAASGIGGADAEDAAVTYSPMPTN